jgi:hypothetical protein
MDKLQIERVRDRLQAFDFKRLFIEDLGWSHARGAKPVTLMIANESWQATPIAELSGVVVFLLRLGRFRLRLRFRFRCRCFGGLFG